MKLTILILFLLISSSNAFSAPCDFTKLKLKKREGNVGTFVVDKKTALVVEGGQEGKEVYNGPVWISVAGEKKCKFEGSNFFGFAISKSKKTLSFEALNGSCMTTQTVDVKTCTIGAAKADYCGGAKLEKPGRLVSHVFCDPISDTLANCSSAHVYNFKGKDCAIALDEKSSNAMTKKELGMEIPLNDVFYIQDPKTPKAKRVK